MQAEPAAYFLLIVGVYVYIQSEADGDDGDGDDGYGDDGNGDDGNGNDGDGCHGAEDNTEVLRNNGGEAERV
jgi:hypothetical protein